MQFFFQFTSFLTPGRIYRVYLEEAEGKLKQPAPELWQETRVPGFDPKKFVTRQEFYQSKDGTRVPMFIVHNKVLRVHSIPLLRHYNLYIVHVQYPYSSTVCSSLANSPCFLLISDHLLLIESYCIQVRVILYG